MVVGFDVSLRLLCSLLARLSRKALTAWLTHGGKEERGILFFRFTKLSEGGEMFNLCCTLV